MKISAINNVYQNKNLKNVSKVNKISQNEPNIEANTSNVNFKGSEGRIVGTIFGALIGSFIPVVGTILGALIGYKGGEAYDNDVELEEQKKREEERRKRGY